MGGAARFDVTMLACHTLSTCELFLYFSGALAVEYGLAFEAALLIFKTGLEISMAALTPDLVVHHAGIGLSFMVAVYFPAHASTVLFVNIIHLPLAINYARRLIGAARGHALDRCFGAGWMLVVGARVAMLLEQAVRASRPPLPVRWAFWCSLPVLVVLDVQWTRETFAKRTLPSAWPLVLGFGGLLGAFFERREAMAVWAAAAAACLSLVLYAVRRMWTDPAVRRQWRDGERTAATTD